MACKVTTKARSKSDRLRDAVKVLCREITYWRDGLQCVERNIDGGHCGGGMQWGHVVPQGQSAYLALDLGNAHVQCAAHNTIHGHFQAVYNDWVRSKFGNRSFDALKQARSDYEGYQFDEPELLEKLAQYNELYDNRFHASVDVESLVSAGYYGEFIKEAWIKEGRI